MVPLVIKQNLVQWSAGDKGEPDPLGSKWIMMVLKDKGESTVVAEVVHTW